MARQFFTFRTSPELIEGLRHAGRLHGRSVSAELRFAAEAHLKAVAEAERDLDNDDDPGDDPGRVETTALSGKAERAPA